VFLATSWEDPFPLRQRPLVRHQMRHLQPEVLQVLNRQIRRHKIVVQEETLRLNRQLRHARGIKIILLLNIELKNTSSC
jgi:hypothetical protein